MRAALKLEEFGSTAYMGWDKSGPWVAKLVGFSDQYGYEREFMRFRRDFSAASSTGNRGIWRYYALEPGVYQVNERTSWKHVRRYFILVREDGTYQEINQSEANEWVTKNISVVVCLMLPDNE